MEACRPQPHRHYYSMRKEKFIQERTDTKTTTFVVRVPTGNGKEICKNFRAKDYGTPAQTLNKACEWRDSVLSGLKQGAILENSVATVSDMFYEYMELYINRDGTRKLNQFYFEKYIKPDYGDRPIVDVTAKDVMVNLNSLVYSQSDNSLNKIKSCWAKIFKNARVDHILIYNPMEEIIMPKSQKAEYKRNQYVTNDDVEKIIYYLEHDQTPHWERDVFDEKILVLIIKFIRATGVRPAECYAISRKTSYSFKDRKIFIDKCYGTDREGDGIVKPKANSIRTLPMTDETEDILRQAEEMSDHEYIFQTWGGHFQNTRSVGTRLMRAAKACGMEGFHLYSLRHMMATDLIKETGDIRGTMEIMGHTGQTAAQSLDYARSNPKTLAELLEKTHDFRTKNDENGSNMRS